MNTAALKPDLDEARRFLELIAPGEKITFQTFDDKKDSSKNHSLSRVFHGTFHDHSESLRKLNDEGAGIFFMVNKGDGLVRQGKKTCRTNANVTAVRALFVDLDGAPLKPVLEEAVAPSVVVESSPGRWHAYWPVSGCPLDSFKGYQKALAQKLQGDEAVNDLARVMRLPGFLHKKGTPFLTKMIIAATAGRTI